MSQLQRFVDEFNSIAFDYHAEVEGGDVGIFKGSQKVMRVWYDAGYELEELGSSPYAVGHKSEGNVGDAARVARDMAQQIE